MNPTRAIAALALATVTLSACSSGDTTEDAGYSPESPAPVTLLSHDSFVIGDDIIDGLAEEGIELQLLPGGDAGAVVNQAILSVDNPQGDVLFGIDSTLLTRGLDAGLFEPYEADALTAIPDELELDPEHRVTPIDVSDVCINYVVDAYDAELPVPTTLDDLADPAYAGQLVVPNPATSSPGLAFLLRTIAEYGEEGWQDYWRSLVRNDVEVTAGWEDAYYGVFSGPSSDGDRPLVVSYSTSPPAEVLFGADPEADVAPTGSVIESCYRQIEFAGVLSGTDVPSAARRVVEVLAGEEFQASVPLGMFVEPARDDVELPEVFVKFAQRPDVPTELDPATITQNRERWIAEWTELVLG
jgi:thiamine transport system substrate-binding protein